MQSCGSLPEFLDFMLLTILAVNSSWTLDQCTSEVTCDGQGMRNGMPLQTIQLMVSFLRESPKGFNSTHSLPINSTRFSHVRSMPHSASPAPAFRCTTPAHPRAKLGAGGRFGCLVLVGWNPFLVSLLKGEQRKTTKV